MNTIRIRIDICYNVKIRLSYQPEKQLNVFFEKTSSLIVLVDLFGRTSSVRIKKHAVIENCRDSNVENPKRRVSDSGSGN